MVGHKWAEILHPCPKIDIEDFMVPGHGKCKLRLEYVPEEGPNG